MKSQMKGVLPAFRRSARLKKREAFRPFTSARASSDTDTAETDRVSTQRGLWSAGVQRSPGSFPKV